MSNYKFNSQTELTKWAYEQCNQDKQATIILIAEHLKARTVPMKEHKIAELDAQGDRGYVNYAKIKFREMFRVRKTTSKPKEEIVLKGVI
jgi:hypothetical protein